MRILFCSNPLSEKQVDSDYLNEYTIAQTQGFDIELIDFEELVFNSNPSAAVKRIIPALVKETAVFRGWMMKPAFYEKLYNALLEKNIQLINSPQAYQHCHYLPESYPIIKNYTAKTVWLSLSEIKDSFANIHRALRIFANSPVIIKDYVKSRKHEWFEACYIPDASDQVHVEQVVKKFIKLQGEDINEGLVFREFLNLDFLTVHPKSHMPLSKEFRVFFIDGKPLYAVNYWDEGKYEDLRPELEPFLDVALKIQSRFFTMDIAKTQENGWIIMELGDGQVSGLPLGADVKEFYRRIKESAEKL